MSHLTQELKVSNFAGAFLSSTNKRCFERLLKNEMSRLRVISLKHCHHIDASVITILHWHANPFFLQELHLDGCESLTDESFDVLKIMPEEANLYKEEL